IGTILTVISRATKDTTVLAPLEFVNVAFHYSRQRYFKFCCQLRTIPKYITKFFNQFLSNNFPICPIPEELFILPLCLTCFIAKSQESVDNSTILGIDGSLSTGFLIFVS